MSDVMKPVVALAMLAALDACRQSEQDRARNERARAEIQAPAAQSDVVQELRTPTDPGRLIYDKQPDLSYATLLRTRPDLAHPDGSPPTSAAPPPAAPRARPHQE